MTEPLWTAAELTQVFGPASGGTMPDATGVSIDTRTLQPGDLFFAIQGDRTDGHDYIEQAFAAGAAAAVVARDVAAAKGPLIVVADTLKALETLGGAARARSQAQIAAVTGSVGKTSTKEMLRLMLSELGATHAAEKSYNNHWGVPLTLARLPRDADYAVFEIGMNHAGEITPLTRMVRPHVAIVTTVAPVHIEFFASVEAIAEAKAEIFLGLGPRGAAVINRDSEFFALLARRAADAGAARCLGFGRSEQADWRLAGIKPVEQGSEVEAYYTPAGVPLSFALGAPGEHLAANAVGALAVVEALGCDPEQAAVALTRFGAPKGRGAQSEHDIEGGTLLLLDEAYNANPASMEAALKVLGSLPGPRATRRIAVLGDMLELGAQGEALHRALSPVIEAQHIDRVFCCGPQMATLYAALPDARRGAWAATSEELKGEVLTALRAGDAVTVKGSLGSRMGLIVEAIKQTYPPRSGPGTTAAA
jgi:UDP-N-acetylmuramoyl-tripeptide--D-alanyl-D-alanine ligase